MPETVSPADPGQPAPSATPAPVALPSPSMPVGPPFDAAFFVSVLPDRVQEQCGGNPEAVPVVELQLADGALLDLCHITTLTPAWLAATVYRDPATCDDMDLHFLPYAMISRIVLSLHAPARRALGFRVGRPAAPA